MRLKQLILLLCCVFCFALQRPIFAAPGATGAWSKAVDGVRGRLIIAEDPPFNGTRMIAVYLELRNVSDIGNPLGLYYDGGNVRGALLDKRGKEVPAAGLPADIMSPSPYWLVLPFDGTLRFRVSVSGYGVPKNGGVLIGLDRDAWLIKPAPATPYFLGGTFHAVAKKDGGAWRPWTGTLQLPKVEIPMPAINKVS